MVRRLEIVRLLSFYYLGGTIAFGLLDWIVHAPIRAAFLGSLEARLFYYAILIGVGLFVRRRPDLAAVIAMAESGINFILVLLSIVLPIYILWNQVLEGAPTPTPYTIWRPIGALLSGLVFLRALRLHHGPLAARGGDWGARQQTLPGTTLFRIATPIRSRSNSHSENAGG